MDSAQGTPEGALQRIRAGEALTFGRRLKVDWYGLLLDSERVGWRELEGVDAGLDGGLTLSWLPRDGAPRRAVLAGDEIAERPLLMQLTQHFRRSSGTIGETSARLGMDVRELMIDGYTQRQISAVLRHEKTLRELYAEGPAGEPQGPAARRDDA